MPRSSVSTVIKTLEERLGARLLTRSTRSVVPTQDGLAFYDRCHRVLGDFEELETFFQETSHPLSGRLTIDVPGRMGRLIFALALPGFMDRYPGIEIELRSTDRAVDLIQEGVDCVVRAGELPDSSLIARPVGRLEQVNCAAPAYLEKYGMPADLAALEDHLAIRYASPTTGRIEVLEVEVPGGLQHGQVQSRVTVNNAEGSIACCLAGLGMIEVPAYDVRPYLKAGSLVEVLPEARAPALPLNFLYPHRRHLSRRLQSFLDWGEGLLREKVLAP